MTPEAAPPTALSEFQKRARLFGTIAVVAIVLIVGVVGLTAIVVVQHWRTMAPDSLQRLALTRSPAPFYLWALWSLRGMFGDFARVGPAFPPTLAAALVRIGWGLLLGALTTLATSRFVLAIGPRRAMGGSFATFNVPAFTLGIVALALIATAHILRRGAEIEAQAAPLKAELGDFV